MKDSDDEDESRAVVKTGFVVIGRNEGARLQRCLESIARELRVIQPDQRQTGGVSARPLPIVYVDSGSTDDSVSLAEGLGVVVDQLDTSTKFTAARARNQGFQRLSREFPQVGFVHFVDGDCELQAGWLGTAVPFLESNPDVAVVCGRRRERFPERSVFNRLCDLEWNTPTGQAKACGGDALMRADVVAQVGGYRESMIAGEEPELCFRMRRLGYTIERLDVEMTLHDAAMTSVDQWFRRAKRAGHAYAETAALHFGDPEQPGTRHTLGNLVWGVGLPGAGAVGSFVNGPLAAVGVAAGYGTLFFRSYRYERRRRTGADARLFALSCTASKLPEALGALTFFKNRLVGSDSKIIEYKRAIGKNPDVG